LGRDGLGEGRRPTEISTSTSTSIPLLLLPNIFATLLSTSGKFLRRYEHGQLANNTALKLTIMTARKAARKARRKEQKKLKQRQSNITNTLQVPNQIYIPTKPATPADSPIELEKDGLALLQLLKRKSRRWRQDFNICEGPSTRTSWLATSSPIVASYARGRMSGYIC
jgi:hypothetical protein